MNTPQAMPAATNDPDFIHNSTRTTLSTNADPTGRAPASVMLRTTRLIIRWLDGDVVLHFVAHEVDVAPTARTMPRRGAR